MSEVLYEKHKLSSFDKSYSTEAFIKNPDKYRQLESDTSEAENLISRGGGYSYVAASFKKETLSIVMKNFNRILHFDKKKKIIKVESGITIIELLNFTLKFGLWIPQIPGYPYISIGGAVASNVHGKSGGQYGTIRNAIKDILIFHKNHGWINLSNAENKKVFDLTIGGYGLTGTIVNVTLQLIDIEGFKFQTSIKKTNSIIEAVNYIKDNKEKNDLIYSWHRIVPNSKNFGDGFIYCNKTSLESKNKSLDLIKSCKPKFLSNLFYFCIWNNFSTKTFNNFFFNYHYYLKKKIYKDDFNNVMFPFLGKEFYFSSFGKKGFFESQFLVAYEKVESFLNDFRKLVNSHKPVITLFSLKGMCGEHKYLRFEGNMICLTFDVVRDQKNINFLNELDRLYIEYDVVPSIIKDSRLKKEVFDKCYRFANEFRKDLIDFDRNRFYKSELSDRLDL
jgi:decaprenylphospho-beta-D-ribofuranose 2-oxidase